MTSENGPERAGEQTTLAQRAVRRRVAGVEETARSDVRALMDAGLALMIENGGRRGPRVADIVAAAGLSNDAFYRYFAGKDALVDAIVEQGARTVVSYVRHRMAAAADPAGQLRAGVAALLKQADADLATKTRAVLNNGTTASSGARHAQVALVDALADLFTPPAAELGTPDPARTARTMAITAVAALQYHLFSEQPPTAADLAHLTAFLLAGTTRTARLRNDP
ncbi:MAG: TetR/AcrR family transcriptional regulator [Streptomycetaceae bacterium]|nr:TetR/AcrR family transcriptional regulator [Streptomycetaceae bacterium]